MPKLSEKQENELCEFTRVIYKIGTEVRKEIATKLINFLPITSIFAGYSADDVCIGEILEYDNKLHAGIIITYPDIFPVTDDELIRFANTIHFSINGERRICNFTKMQFPLAPRCKSFIMTIEEDSTFLGLSEPFPYNIRC